MSELCSGLTSALPTDCGIMLFIYAAVIAAAVCIFSVMLYMRMPPRWLCEFDELPGEMHMPGIRGRSISHSRPAVFILIFAASFYCLINAGSGPAAPAALICLAAAALGDAEYMIIPDQLLLAAAAAGAADALICGRISEAAAGAVCGGGLMLLSSLCAAVFYGSGSIGAGDIKMMAVCGLLAGTPAAAVLLFMTSCIALSVFIAAGMTAGRLSPGSFVPAGPFIALAAVIFMR